MSKEAMQKLKGTLLKLGTRNYCLEIDDCERSLIVRRLLRNGEIRPPICQYCGIENKFPLKVELENNQYVLRCTSCKETIFKEG